MLTASCSTVDRCAYSGCNWQDKPEWIEIDNYRDLLLEHAPQRESLVEKIAEAIRNR